MKKTLAIVLMVLCTFSVFAQGQTETTPAVKPSTTTTTTPAQTEAPAVVAKPTTAVFATASWYEVLSFLCCNSI